MPYTKLIKPLLILVVIGGIYYLGFSHADNKAKAEFRKIELAQKAKLRALETQHKKEVYSIEEAYNNQLRNSNAQFEQDLVQLRKKLNENTDECLDYVIPSGIIDSL